MFPGVVGGSIPFTATPGDAAAWLEPRRLLIGAVTAGELRPASSFLTRAALEGVGEETEPDALLARSSGIKLGAGVAEANGFRPLVVASPAEPFARTGA
mgnify:CR=1 FL=1